MQQWGTVGMVLSIFTLPYLSYNIGKSDRTVVGGRMDG
jgi:hypothetical protein